MPQPPGSGSTAVPLDKISPDSTFNDTVDDINEEDTSELRAQFAHPAKISSNEVNTKPQTSPLLSSTPPTVAKALIKAYPYLLIINKLLSVATWTNDDYWINVVIISVYSLVILYFESLIVWFGHIIIVGIITMYAFLNNRIVEETNLHPTLDDVVQALTATCIKADMLLNPITSLSLTAYDIKRLLFTTIFLTPIYLIVTFLLIKPRVIILISGIFVLTYHSSYSRVTRTIIWKIKLARLLVFYLTGLDFSQAKNSSLFAAAFAKVQKNSGLDSKSSGTNKPVRFTYVIYENQRRWLGIGWTSNLLSYERTPWTDEFLNESSSIETFKLPNTSDENNPYESSSKISGATWRWVDKTWRLDSTNDGAITLPNSKRSKTTANPTSDEGFIYYDNTWKKPSVEDSYSKYTRRRRWIRTAELVFNDNAAPGTGADTPAESVINEGISTSTTSASTTKNEDLDSPKKRKSLRFADTLEEHDEEIDPLKKKPLLDQILSEDEEDEEVIHATSTGLGGGDIASPTLDAVVDKKND
ncbi:integral peroxisomal membrane peroxin-domain-containing protein [Scheffersomyces xylosifermentans]|uniref:integral peroxisomal membrane peroxin-domain-containing protein n=1 Tax=Scheffersomyces xylosifermentans TaxID=1304137 RepID=UPI00315D7F85